MAARNECAECKVTKRAREKQWLRKKASTLVAPIKCISNRCAYAYFHNLSNRRISPMRTENQRAASDGKLLASALKPIYFHSIFTFINKRSFFICVRVLFLLNTASPSVPSIAFRFSVRDKEC